VFPVRYGLNFYINLLRNSVFKGLIHGVSARLDYGTYCDNCSERIKKNTCFLLLLISDEMRRGSNANNAVLKYR
jgi:hypothetical protein